jgi:hypothetical protein
VINTSRVVIWVVEEGGGGPAYRLLLIQKRSLDALLLETLCHSLCTSYDRAFLIVERLGFLSLCH